MFKTFADLKRFFASEDAIVEQIRHDWAPDGRPGPRSAMPRRIARTQTNAVQFEGGSWWYFPPAKCVRFTEDGFETCLKQDGSFDAVMAYSCHH